MLGHYSSLKLYTPLHSTPHQIPLLLSYLYRSHYGLSDFVNSNRIFYFVRIK